MCWVLPVSSCPRHLSLILPPSSSLHRYISTSLLPTSYFPLHQAQRFFACSTSVGPDVSRPKNTGAMIVTIQGSHGASVVDFVSQRFGVNKKFFTLSGP